MKFEEKERTGEVMGNKVIAKPVPFKLMAALNEAQRHNDDAGVVSTMVAVVSGFVKMEDGSDIDANEVSQKALGELFKFAVGTEDTLSDFTPQRSPTA